MKRFGPLTEVGQILRVLVLTLQPLIKAIVGPSLDPRELFSITTLKKLSLSSVDSIHLAMKLLSNISRLKTYQI